MHAMPMSKLKEWMEFAEQWGTGSFWDDADDTGAAENAAFTSASASPAAWVPPVDIYRAEGELLVVMELPGVRREQLELLAEGCELTVRGLRRTTAAAVEPAGEHLLGERRTGPFERTIRLPLAPAPDGRMHASLADGLLLVRIPCLYAEPAVIPLE